MASTDIKHKILFFKDGMPIPRWSVTFQKDNKQGHNDQKRIAKEVKKM